MKLIDALKQLGRPFVIQIWYVIGRKEKIEGEKRDPYRSRFWIKK